MAIGTVRIPQLQQSIPVVDEQGRMTNEFARRLNDILGQIAAAVNAIAVLPEIQEALANAQELIANVDEATQAAQAAADAANAAAEGNKREAALQGSYISPDRAVTATPETVSIVNHTRYYADDTTASVMGGNVEIGPNHTGETYYVSYVDPERDGGNVTYIVNQTQPTQTGDTHVVGAVTIPIDGAAAGGRGPLRPGYVSPIVEQ